MPSEHVHYDILNEEIKQVMLDIASLLKLGLPKDWGFNLLLFEYNKEDGAVFYISGADKKTTIEMLRKEADRLESM